MVFETDQQEKSELDYCLQPVLRKLEWHGDEGLLFESMPHLMSILNMEKFSSVMNNLGYSTKSYSINLQDINEKIFPCLFIPNDNSAPLVILANDEKGLYVFDSASQKEVIISKIDIDGIGHSFKKKSEQVIQENYKHWFKEVIYDCKGIIGFLMAVGLLQAIFFIAPPAYIMFLYDKVINTNSYGMLFTFTIGIVIALVALIVLMNIRSRVLGYFGSKLQNRIGNIIFMRLLKLQPFYIESAPLSRQLIRIHDFNQIREFFGGPLFSAVADLPFVIIFLAFIWFVGGALVIVPIVTVFVYFAVAKLIWFFSKKIVGDNAAIRSKYQNYLLETFGGMRSLQFSGFQNIWLSNFKEVSAIYSEHGKNILLLSSVSEAIFDALTLFSGIAVLITGSILIINEELQIGAMIAVLFVIWRLLSPIKMLAVMYPRFIQVIQSAKQINQLMQYPTEIPTEKQWKNSPKKISGNIHFDQVSFRYPNTDTLAIKNVSFTIKQGETAILIGPTGSGKSTLANLLLHIYPILGGYIYIDGVNIKQYDVNVLRKNVSYVPQKTELFYGTIEQNIKLTAPLSTRSQVIEAARAANLYDIINQLPEKFDTRIRFYGDDRFGASFVQKVSLARAYLRDAPILLLDEPTSSLDEENIHVFTNYVKSIKGKKTVIILGHSAQFAELADRMIVVLDGYIVGSGSPDEVIKNIPKGMI